jgi:TetR/AcrR family transcriptional regulator
MRTHRERFAPAGICVACSYFRRRIVYNGRQPYRVEMPDLEQSRSKWLASKVLKKEAKIEIVKTRRRQGRAAITRQKILKAGAAEFAPGGFDGTTTRSIALRANVPHALVIYHFESKLGVWQAVQENVLNQLHGEFTRRMEELARCDTVTRLREAGRVLIRFAAKRPEVNWVLTQDVGEAAPRLQSVVEKIIGRDIDLTIGLIREAQSLGRYVEGDPAHLSYVYFGAASRIFMLSTELERTLGQSPFHNAFVEQHIELCERLFFRDPPDAKPR